MMVYVVHWCSSNRQLIVFRVDIVLLFKRNKDFGAAFKMRVAGAA